MRCLYCNKPVRKHTQTVNVRTTPSSHPGAYGRELVVETLPRTIEECRKLTNQQVVKVERQYAPDRETGRYEKTGFIDRFNEWDGEHYLPSRKFFCTNNCAMDFGRAAAEAGYRMKRRAA